MKTLTTTAAVLSLYLMTTALESNAGIILSNVDNDLLLEIKNPILFVVSRDVSTSRLGFTLPGAINVAGTGGFQLLSDPVTEPVLSGADFISGDPDVGLIRGGPALEILYFLPTVVDLTIGDEVVLGTGQLTLPNFFDFSIIGGLNYSTATDVLLTGLSRVSLSELTPTMAELPIPGTLSLMVFCFGLFGIASKLNRSQL